jgi:hypothetical protein
VLHVDKDFEALQRLDCLNASRASLGLLGLRFCLVGCLLHEARGKLVEIGHARVVPGRPAACVADPPLGG